MMAWRSLLLLCCLCIVSAVEQEAIESYLSPAERVWLHEHPEVRLGVDPDWPPLEYFDTNGVYSGIASDYIAELNNRLKTNWEPVPNLKWVDVVAAIKERRLDVLPMAASTPERESYLLFTKPYISFPMVVVMRADAASIYGLEDLEQMRVGVADGYVSHEHLKRDHSYLDLHPFSSAEKGLEQVSLGRIDAYFGTLPSISHVIDKQGLTNLNIAAATPYTFALGMGVRKDWPELVSILNKVLEHIPNGRRREIRSAWFAPHIEDASSLRSMIRVLIVIVSGATVLGVLATLWILGMRKQIQQRRMAEASLREFKLTLDITHDCVFIFDPDDFRFFYVNNGACEQVGYSITELLKMTPLDIKPKLNWDEFSEMVQPLKQGTLDLLSFRTEHRHREGHDVPVQIHLQYIDDGVLSPRFVAVVRDIVQQLEIETELIKARDEAEAGNRAMSTFLAMMSHEIRTPMNAVIGMASTMEKTDLDTEQQEYLDILRDSGEIMLEIIDDLLDYSKLEAGKMSFDAEPFAVADWVSSIHRIIDERMQKKGLRFEVKIESSVPSVLSADAKRLRQIFLNLLSNAAKFTKHGSVHWTLGGKQVGDDFLLMSSVRDTGIGITEDVKERLFSPFIQADSSISRRFGGTGLGLAISRQIARAMGGDVQVTSEFGNGSTFMVTACLAITDSTHLVDFTDGPVTECNDILLSESLRLLVAEDNPINQKVIMMMLKKLGYESDLAVNGCEAMERHAETPYDLILMDMQMPEMDGLETTRRIRELDKTVIIIALTANALPEDEQACMAAGMNGFLAKPVKADVLQKNLIRYTSLYKKGV